MEAEATPTGAKVWRPPAPAAPLHAHPVVLPVPGLPLADGADRPTAAPAAAEASEPRTVLTARQAELLAYCLAKGYYDIPRGTNLRALGRDLGITATSLSLVLRRAEGKIVHLYAQGTGPLARQEHPRPRRRADKLTPVSIAGQR